MAFPHSQRIAWVVKKFNPTLKDTSVLKPHEFGILDWDRCKTLGTFHQSPFIEFALGSPNQPVKGVVHPKLKNLNNNNAEVSFKSGRIYGKSLLPARIAKPSKSESTQSVYLGYDGISDCETFDFKCGKTYNVRISLLPGSPVSAFSHGLVDTATITTRACDTCNTSCEEPNLCGDYMDDLVTAINGLYTSPYVTAQKILSCCTPTTAIPKFNCTDYCITLCSVNLSDLQLQYPNADITLKETKSGLSTFTFKQDASLPAPAAFTQTSIIIPECEDCAAYPGHTLVPAVPATATTLGSPVQCVLTTPISTSWSTCGTSYRVKRKVTTVIENPDCGKTAADVLPKIVAAYASDKSVVAGSVVLEKEGDCRFKVSLEQYSSCMQDGCDTVATAMFEDVSPFEGNKWGVDVCEGWTVSAGGCPVPPVEVDQSCQCGIKLTAAFFDYDTNSCVYDPCDSINYDPILFEVSISEVTGPLSPVGSMPLKVPVRHASSPKRKFLSGAEVLRDVMMYRQLRGNEMYANPSTVEGIKMNKALGVEYGVDLDKFYYALHIPVNKYGNQNYSNFAMGENYEYVLYFEEANYAVMLQVVTAYNLYASSAGVDVPLLSF